jgi:phosphotriesterase-related protein
MIEHRACAQWLTRREAMAVLGGTIVASLSRVRGETTTSAAATSGIQIASRRIIRTLLKDVSPDALGNGAILFHEHLSYTNEFIQKVLGEGAARRGAAPPPMPTERYFMEDLDLMVDEVRQAGREGVGCLVDGGHADMGRSVPFLKQLSEKSGMPIIASGGYYRQLTYPPKIARLSEEQLAEEFVRDARLERWGAFGEIGVSDDITSDERKVLRAVGKAHVRTGLPIFTHTANGKGALEQLDILESVGVRPQNITVGHLCCYFDPQPWRQLHDAVARRGAYVGFDRVGGEQGGSGRDAARAQMVLAFLEAGHADQALLASDFSFLSSTKRAGGGGYARAVTKFVPMLRAGGVKDDTLRKILVDNPRRFLAFEPPTR